MPWTGQGQSITFRGSQFPQRRLLLDPSLTQLFFYSPGMSPGARTMETTAVDKNGDVAATVLPITVGAQPTTTVSDIQDMSGWENCGRLSAQLDAPQPDLRRRPGRSRLHHDPEPVLARARGQISQVHHGWPTGYSNELYFQVPWRGNQRQPLHLRPLFLRGQSQRAAGARIRRQPDLRRYSLDLGHRMQLQWLWQVEHLVPAQRNGFQPQWTASHFRRTPGFTSFGTSSASTAKPHYISAELFLRVSPLFHRFANGLTVRNLMILHKAMEGEGVGWRPSKPRSREISFRSFPSRGSARGTLPAFAALRGRRRAWTR